MRLPARFLPAFVACAFVVAAVLPAASARALPIVDGVEVLPADPGSGDAIVLDVALLFPSSGYLPVDAPLFGRIGNAFEVILQYAGPSGPSLPAITPGNVPVELGALPAGDYTFELLFYADGGLADTASGGFSVPEPPIWLLLLAGVLPRCRRNGAPAGR